MQCQEIIDRALAELKAAFRCIPYEQGVGIATPYLYPDNDLIEVFVQELTGNRVRVTDLGKTLRHLASQGIDVTLANGQLEKEGEAVEVGALLVDVAAAAHGVAGLAYTSKSYEPAEFPDEVSGFLTENSINHERNAKVHGVSGRQYRLTLRINGRIRPEILVEAMSPSQQAGITAVVNRVVREWVDIDAPRKVSLLNDEDFLWRQEDIILLGNLSTVHRWSHKDEFLRFMLTGNTTLSSF
jgi:hypothetical protein